MKDKILAIRLTRKEVEQLKEAAKVKGTTVTELVKPALKRSVEEVLKGNARGRLEKGYKLEGPVERVEGKEICLGMSFREILETIRYDAEIGYPEVRFSEFFVKLERKGPEWILSLKLKEKK